MAVVGASSHYLLNLTRFTPRPQNLAIANFLNRNAMEFMLVRSAGCMIHPAIAISFAALQQVAVALVVVPATGTHIFQRSIRLPAELPGSLGCFGIA